MIEPTFKAGEAHARAATRAEARKTALVVATVLAGVAAWNLYRGRWTVVYVLGGAALLLVVAGLLVPAVSVRFHTLWMKLAAVLGYVNSRVLLGLMYYGVFTPYGVVSRLVGRDPLGRRKPGGETFWVERKRTRQEREGFERLF
ncbi:MAG TPA: SxtJ family membrane protein [Pyrinomonadaceae bacterium]|nr:SxtJ family membrane protein [Pyrinomonadaceae bacterium]